MLRGILNVERIVLFSITTECPNDDEPINEMRLRLPKQSAALETCFYKYRNFEYF